VSSPKDSAFEAAALPHLDAVYRTALALCGQTHLAEDLAQAAMLKAVQGFASFRPGTDCNAWLLRILRNTWIDWLRHKKVEGVTLSLDAAEFEPAAAENAAGAKSGPGRIGDVLEAFSDPEIIRALGRLPEDQRLTLVLIDVEGLSYEEAASIMDVPAGTVKSRASRARLALAERLREYARSMGFGGRKT